MNSFSVVLCDLLNAHKPNFEFPHVQHTLFFTGSILVLTCTAPGSFHNYHTNFSIYSMPFFPALTYLF